MIFSTINTTIKQIFYKDYIGGIAQFILKFFGELDDQRFAVMPPIDSNVHWK